jgi:hypothetical protein
MTGNRVVLRVAISLAVALAIALVVRVATDPSDPVATQSVVAQDVGRSALVTAADFEGIGPSSPGAVVLRWWQANQFNESARSIATFYTDGSRAPFAQLRADLRLTRYIFDATKPTILDQRAEGETAQVFTLIPPLGERATSKKSTPYVFKLSRERGSWKLTDSFVAVRAAGERRFARDRRRR